MAILPITVRRRIGDLPYFAVATSPFMLANSLRGIVLPRSIPNGVATHELAYR